LKAIAERDYRIECQHKEVKRVMSEKADKEALIKSNDRYLIILNSFDPREFTTSQ
jgi:hypothetical protein